jgi:hypothetical protein
LEDSGYLKSSQRASGYNLIGNSQASAKIDRSIANSVLSKNPGYLVESISLLRGASEVSILDIYNALRHVRNLKGILYDSHSKSHPVPLFEDATRIASERQTSPIPDPPAARSVPPNETVYLRLKDANFGNSYYRGDIILFQNGLCYTLSNFRSLTYLLIPVIREGNFVAVLYLEPIKEGVLIYGLAGAEVSDFVSSRIHMPSAISKRLEVIISWASDGILRKN